MANARPKGWRLKPLLASFLMVLLSLAGLGGVSGRASSRPGRDRAPGSRGGEKIVCGGSSAKANRNEILKFIESFCAEAVGQEFSAANPELKEVYTIDPDQRVPGEATASHVLLHLKSINGCPFSVDYSCGRFLTRPTDECNVGDEAKQGGYVADGCSLWRTTPLS